MHPHTHTPKTLMCCCFFVIVCRFITNRVRKLFHLKSMLIQKLNIVCRCRMSVWLFHSLRTSLSIFRLPTLSLSLVSLSFDPFPTAFWFSKHSYMCFHICSHSSLQSTHHPISLTLFVSLHFHHHSFCICFTLSSSLHSKKVVCVYILLLINDRKACGCWHCGF